MVLYCVSSKRERGDDPTDNRVRKDKSEHKYGKAFINDKNSEGLGIGKAKKHVAVWFDGERDKRIGDRTAPVKVILEPLDCDGFFTSEYLEKVTIT